MHISGLSSRGQTATLCKAEGKKYGAGTRGEQEGQGSCARLRRLWKTRLGEAEVRLSVN